MVNQQETVLKKGELVIGVRTSPEKIDFEHLKTIFIERFGAEIRDILKEGFDRASLLNPCNSITKEVSESIDNFKKRVSEWLIHEQERESKAREANKDVFYPR